MTSRTHTYACCSQARKHSQRASLWQLHIQLTVILGLGKLLLLWLLAKHLAFTFNYCRSECAAKPHTQPDPKGTEGFILPSVTAQVITPHSRSDYKNYLIRDVHSNDVQSLNGVKLCCRKSWKSWKRGPLQSLILMWDFIEAISKYGCVLIWCERGFEYS